MKVKAKVNNQEVDTDGDWMRCPECDEIDFPLLSWMSYCPICKTELNFQGFVYSESNE